MATLHCRKQAVYLACCALYDCVAGGLAPVGVVNAVGWCVECSRAETAHAGSLVQHRQCQGALLIYLSSFEPCCTCTYKYTTYSCLFFSSVATATTILHVDACLSCVGHSAAARCWLLANSTSRTCTQQPLEGAEVNATPRTCTQALSGLASRTCLSESTTSICAPCCRALSFIVLCP